MAQLQWTTFTSIGFSGSKEGMTGRQESWFMWLMRKLAHATHLDHGDCIGSDAKAHAIAMALRIPCHIHPPSNPRYRRWCTGGTVYAPQSYLKRNCAIVDATSLLIATPKRGKEEQRSGTWHTVRYARKRGRHVFMLGPDGWSTIHYLPDGRGSGLMALPEGGAQVWIGRSRSGIDALWRYDAPIAAIVAILSWDGQGIPPGGKT